MKRLLWVIGRLAAGVGVLTLLAIAGGAAYLQVYLPRSVAPRSFPEVNGELQLEGLDARVDVYRDHLGVPHIYAGTTHDLFLAQGFVHAQDRFWQMDTWRHVGSGRLAEMFGESAVETDAFLRTLGWRQAAERDWETLTPDSRRLLQAYADGVNAYISSRRPEELSLEYAVLGILSPGYRIDPWEPVHSLTWGKAMAWDLRANLDEEVERTLLLKAIGQERLEDLYPPYPADHPSIVEAAPQAHSLPGEPRYPGQYLPDRLLAAVRQNIGATEAFLGPWSSGLGSNSFVVTGARTTTGKAMLANDPHLSAQMPSIWYQVDLQCRPKSEACAYAVAGFSFAGTPGVVIGHNDRIAWGMTNMGADVMDVFVERVNPENPDQYEVDGEWVDFEVRTELIEVAGSEPVEVHVRMGRHGPVISDTYGPVMDKGDLDDQEFVPFRDRAGISLPEAYALALSWTALTRPSPFEAVWAIDRASNWDEFRSAARDFHTAAQNLVYADVEGNIGYQMPGDIPVRLGGDGRFPVPGWNSKYEWGGFVPFDEQPYVFNPAEDYVVTANNRVAGDWYEHLITNDWNHGFRAQRLEDLILTAPDRLAADDLRAFQLDTMDPLAPRLLPLVLGALQSGAPMGKARAQEALEMLQAWDYRAEAESGAAAVYAAIWSNLLDNTFTDDIPEDLRPEGGARWMEVIRRLLEDPDSTWWDDTNTADVQEDRDAILVRSFEDAVTELEQTLGSDATRWSWGRLHTVTFRNGTLGDSGVGPIESLFNRGPFATSGGESIVNATGWEAGSGYTVDWLPSFRMVIDLEQLPAATTVHTTGQSGHAYHRHYDDMTPLWADGQHYQMLWSENDVQSQAEGHLVLLP